MHKIIKTLELSKFIVPIIEIFLTQIINFNMDFHFTRFEGNLLFFLVPAMTGILLWFLELHFKNKELLAKIETQKEELLKATKKEIDAYDLLICENIEKKLKVHQSNFDAVIKINNLLK